MNKWIKFIFSHLMFLLFVTGLQADINGLVFRDLAVDGTALNTYGSKDSNELGVAGVTVTAYYDGGTSTTTTGADGTWSITTTSDVRVEFSDWPIYLNESPNTANNIAVQFVSDGDTSVDFALHEPSDYSNTSTPDYVLSRQQAGASTNNSEPGVETVHYGDSNLSSDFCNEAGDRGIGPVPTVSAEVKDVGSTWGQAFQKNKQRLFLSASLQRHVGLTSVGLGRVSILDYSAGVNSVTSTYIDLQGVSPANGGADIDLGSVCRAASCKDDSGNTGIADDYTLPDNASDPSIDLDAYAKVGKMSFGDIDFDQTTNTLWLVNLNQKGLISVDASGDLSNLSSATKQYSIENMTNAPSCTNGELRPWALTIHHARGYLGAVCDESDASNTDNNVSTDSRAFVLSFDLSDPTAGFNIELDIPLDYKNGGESYDSWKTWSDDNSRVDRSHWFDEYNQAILGDIEFDENDTMYIAFINRFAMQETFENNRPVSGDTSEDENVLVISDLLRACYESNSTYSLEGTGTCTQNNHDGYFLYDRGGDGTPNYSGGAMALLKGSSQLLHLTIDPASVGENSNKYYSTVGVNTLNINNGDVDNWYSIMYTNPQNGDDCASGKSHSGYNAKGASLGDVELLTAPTPTEIGSRVWFDEDSDGIQDANESGIADVNVTLYTADGTFIATVQTDANGYYLFSNDPLGTDTSNAEYNLTELLVNSAYIVQIPNIKGINKQTELDGKVLTLTDVGEGSYTNVNDSDGAVSENDANASIVASEIAYSGANNHNIAFGFRPFSSTLTGHVYKDENGDGTQNGSDVDLEHITVTAVDSNGVTHTTETNASGDYTFTDLSVGDANITIDESDDDFPTGAAQTEGRNPTTVTIVDGNNVEENNGFHLPIVTSITSDTQTEGTGNDLVHTVTMSASTSVDRNYTFNVVDNSTNGVNDYNLTYIFSDGVVDNGDGNISVPAGVSSFTVSVKVIDDDTAEDDEFYDITVGTVSATGTILDDDKGAIHGHVFEDSNGDGTQQFDEANLSGVDVIITDSNDVVTTVTTDANGSYSATDLQEGNVTVDVNNSTLPANLTKQTAGTDPDTVTVTAGEDTNAGDDGYQQPPASQVKAVIGNSVWYDENANGVQDAGESGIANVTVTLKDSGDVVIATTVTDTKGGYLFNNLEAGTYSVTVTPPSGMDATYDEDATLDNVTSVTVAEGEKHLSADFGYNWVSPTDTTNPPTDATGAIGDRIWNDANGNGVQDAGESGIGGVIVTLMNDANKDGIYGGTGDTNVTATTDADGYYIFDDVARGAYRIDVNTSSLPANFATTPTGDPDSDGDNTSNPIPLAPGDVYLNGDFGYQPSDGSTIGDTIYLDVDADATQNGSEAGIAGVSVALLDDGSHIVATMFTDANGHYAFSGVQAGDYNVRVTDSHAIVSDFILTQDGGNTITVDGSADYLNQDFGYKLSNHSTGDGFIGDTVFLDRDGDDTLDAGEGLEGVTVKLYDEAGVIELYATVTDENGHYTFSGLSADHNYTVKVDTTTLPNSGTNLSNSVDPDGNTANESLVVLNASNSQIDLDQDFGYTASTANTLSGTLFKDSDTNGTLDASESERFENVTVVLLDDANHTVATTKTDANGDYSFTGLNDGNYTVYVSDDLGVMTGYWSTHGANDGADDNAQTTRYTVELTAGETDNTADFGFYKVGGTLGDRVWEDADADGIQDAGESGITDANVTLTITYPNGDTAIVKTVTDANGDYHFYNLMLDENFNSGTLPTYELTVSVSSTYEASPIEEGSDKEVDSSDPTGTSVTVVRGAEDESYDFGFYVIPDVIVGDVTVEEGDDLVFEVNLTSPSSQDINITLTTSDNTAKAGDDYNATTVTITISAGSTTGSVTVPTIEDTTDESDENMTLSVSSTEGGSVGDTTDTGTGTILDDDTVTVLTVSSDSVTEGTDLVHDVNLSGLADANRTYSFSITDNTTEGANDYNLTFVFSDGVVNNGDGTITVPTGVKDFTVTVESIDDTVDEDSEDYTITVGGVGATGTIEDNDAPPTVLTVTDDNVTEGEILEHNVTLSEVSEANTTYCFKIENNTTEDDDYNASDDNITFSEGVTYDENTGEITVPAGVLEFQVFVSSVQDENHEEYEEFYDICIGEVNATGTITQEPEEVLPITISYVYATAYGDSVDVEFATESEMGNVGFNLYAVKDRRWIKLNSEIILGVIDSFELQEYHENLDVPQGLRGYSIGIAGVDVDGKEERHGPFKLGHETGSKSVTTAIDWKKIRKEIALDRKMKTAMRKSMRVTGDIKLEEQSIQLNVPENAVYRLEHEELLTLGIDLKRVHGSDIAISFKGKGVERHIGNLDRKGRWTVGSWIEFKGTKVDNHDIRYLKSNTYILSVDEELAVECDEIEATSIQDKVFENNNRYSSSIPSQDNFYDALFLIKNEGEKSIVREFEIENLDEKNAVSLTVHMSTYKQAHYQVQLLINGEEVKTVQTQERKVWEIDVDIDDLSILNEGTNELEIVATGFESGYNIYYYDKLVVHYENKIPLASKMSAVTIKDKIVKEELEVAEGTNYVIISHPLFMNEMLDHYITQRQSEGWRVQLVNVEDIYQAYGNGMVTPAAIKAYLKDAAQRGVTHVQLVGAATLDYHDYLNKGAISFIPSIYTFTQPHLTHTPSDIAYVLDEEGNAQMAIGRWPVRSLEELEAIINKTLTWKSSGQAASHTALFIAGEHEDNGMYAKQMETLAKQLESTGWSNTKVYLDAFVKENNGNMTDAVKEAREAVLSSLNDGSSITVFSGHGSSKKWAYDGLFKESDIDTLNNNEKPTIALPLSCYATYIDNTSRVTMSHKLLTQGEHGAVSVYGASLLSKYSQNSVIATNIMEYLLEGETLGEAILHTKQHLGYRFKDAITNGNLLGDVTLRLE